MPNASPYGIIKVSPVPDYRGGDPATTRRQFGFQSFSLSWAWGAEASSAEILYLGNEPVNYAAPVSLHVAGYTFYGSCRSDVPMESTSGRLRSLQFVDNRDFLDWDKVFCAFNLPDERVVAGVRQKRYKHCLPENFDTFTWTYTTVPYAARDIIRFLLLSPTVYDTWRTAFHVDQKKPVFDLDFLNGASLKSALNAVSNAQGLVFTLMGGPFRLVWARKGEGIFPTFTHYRLNSQQTNYDVSPYQTIFPATSNNRTDGFSLSGNPTRIIILGERNDYQVHDIPMVKDWAPAWEQFYYEDLFYEKIYKVGKTKYALTLTGPNGATHTFAVGTVFKDIGDFQAGSPLAFIDPEQVVSRQLARACALEITLRDYAALVADSSFMDFRKYTTRSRLDMPCVLYIKQILWRAFRFPGGFTIQNIDGRQIPINSLGLANKMIAKVTHDPLTGLMDWDIDENPDGNGYGIVQGYNVGRDLFRTLRPDRFDLSKWNSSRDVWEHIEFQIDDSGEEDGKYVLFDEPVINSADLIEMVDGYGVFKARPTFTVPPVRIALTFEGEKFRFLKGVATRDGVEQVSGLNGQYLSRFGSTVPPVEVAYASGKLATEIADEYATSLLNRQWIYRKGRYSRVILADGVGAFPLGLALTGLLDRISITVNAQGCMEDVDLTTEAPRETFIPERDLERTDKINALLPGQAELRHQANLSRLIAAALQKAPDTRKTVIDAFNSVFGSDDPAERVTVAGDGVSEQVLPVGTPLQKKPTVVASGKATQTTYVLPAAAGATHVEFGGVTVAQGQPVQPEGSEILVQRSGDILIRVKGPCKAGDLLSLIDAADYVSASGSKSIVAKALQSIVDDSIKLIRARTSSASSASATGFPYQVAKVSETKAKVVPNSYLLRTLNWRDRQHIFGLDVEFTPIAGASVFLETHFDKNAKCVLANICQAVEWGFDVYPSMVRSALLSEGADSDTSKNSWVIFQKDSADPDIALNLVALDAAFSGFDAKRRHWQSFTLIGNFTRGGKGLKFTIAGDEWSFNQCLDTNLMLTGFCEKGTPVQAPIPYAQPLIEPVVLVITNPDDGLTLDLQATVKGAQVTPLARFDFYVTIDGSEPSRDNFLAGLPDMLDVVAASPEVYASGRTVKAIAYLKSATMLTGQVLDGTDVPAGTAKFIIPP
jgi:hypothetical protein